MTSSGSSNPVFLRLWNPSLSYLRRGHDLYSLQGAQSQITWGFSRKRLPLFRSLVQCSMSGFGLTALGFAEGFSVQAALAKGFTEAWERLWYQRVKSKQIGLPFPVSSTNGFAAGPSSEFARIRSRLELIERAVIQTLWSERIPAPLIDTPPDITLTKLRLARRGWKVTVRQVDSLTLGVVLLGIAKHESHGIVFDSVHVDSCQRAHQRLLFSLERMIHADIAPLDVLPSVAGPLEHAAFYRNTNNASAFAFLEGSGGGSVELNKPNALESIVLTSAGRFPSVVVSYHPDWPKLSWGTQSIYGKNIWPHPIA